MWSLFVRRGLRIRVVFCYGQVSFIGSYRSKAFSLNKSSNVRHTGRRTVVKMLPPRQQQDQSRSTWFWWSCRCRKLVEIAEKTRDRREEDQLGLRERWARVLSGKLDGELSALVVSVFLSMKFIARHANVAYVRGYDACFRNLRVYLVAACSRSSY